MTNDVLNRLVGREDLSGLEAEDLMRSIMSGSVTDDQVADVLVALRNKGETVEEITGFARAMRAHLVPVTIDPHGAVDTCGTGGDGLGTFNVSTATAIVVAGMGITVAKHGNRAVSSSCGSADVLEALGVNIDHTPDDVVQLIEETRIGFMFAPRHHPAMKYAAAARKKIGTRTVFNILGPLTNPAGVTRQLVGVYDRGLTETVVRVLQALGSERVYAVHGHDGSDEVSITGPTRVTALESGKIRTFDFDALSVGIPRAPERALAGGSARENAVMIEGIILGNASHRRDAVVVNAAFAAMAAGRADTPEEGVAMAVQSIDSGRALGKLQALRRVSNALARGGR